MTTTDRGQSAELSRPGFPERASGPVIVWANWYRFRPAQQLAHARVLSRCYLWAAQGSGTVASNGREFRLEQNGMLRLPWGHSIEYRADARAPFRLGTLHVVPEHATSDPVVPEVALLLGDPGLARSRAAGVEPEPSVTTTASGAGRRIAELGAFAIDRFHAEPWHERTFRLLAELVELEALGWAAGRTSTALPVAFEQMTAYIVDGLARPLSVAEVAAAGDCSPTTAERLFNRHAGCSMQTWIRQRRMREAATMLRTSGLRVAEVAEAVGYADPLYFSRVFRAAFDVPPSRYAAEDALP